MTMDSKDITILEEKKDGNLNGECWTRLCVSIVYKFLSSFEHCSHQYKHFPSLHHVYLHYFSNPTFSMNGLTYTLSSPYSCQASHLVFNWRRPIHQYLRDTFWTPSHLLLSISLFPDHYGRCRTRTTHVQRIPNPLPLALWQSQPTFLYMISLIFLSTSQIHQHKMGLKKYTRLLHRLVSTRTHSNSNMQINWNTVQLFYLCQKVYPARWFIDNEITGIDYIDKMTRH